MLIAYLERRKNATFWDKLRVVTLSPLYVHIIVNQYAAKSGAFIGKFCGYNFEFWTKYRLLSIYLVEWELSTSFHPSNDIAANKTTKSFATKTWSIISYASELLFTFQFYYIII